MTTLIRQGWLAALALATLATNGRAEPAASQISTLDGRVYRNASVLRRDTEGLIVRYRPEAGGFGMARIKFANLSEDVKRHYSNSAAESTATLPGEVAPGSLPWLARLNQSGTFEHYRALAELNRSLAGDTFTTYSVSVDAEGKVTSTGTTASQQPYYQPWWSPPIQNNGPATGNYGSPEGTSGTTPPR